MTTATLSAPARINGSTPKPVRLTTLHRDVWSLTTMDARTAQVALVCGTIAFLGFIAGLVIVARSAGDLGAISLAVGGFFTAVGTVVVSLLKARSGKTDGSAT